jgi:hypothetical protein
MTFLTINARNDRLERERERERKGEINITVSTHGKVQTFQ